MIDSAMSSELEAFIDNKDEGETQRNGRHIQAIRVFDWKLIFLRLLLIGLYTLTIVVVDRSWNSRYIPLSDALKGLNVRVKPTLAMTTGESPWVGEPGGPTDDAWHELVGNTSIRVTKEELSRNGNHQQSVPLPKGGGSLVWLGVFHQIHCLKQFRHLNYQDYYRPNMTHAEKYHMEVHINHCIEYLRQAVMCNPDTSLTTLVWTDNDPRPVLDVKPFKRKCVDWEYFMESIIPRVVSFEEVDGLINPRMIGS